MGWTWSRVLVIGEVVAFRFFFFGFVLFRAVGGDCMLGCVFLEESLVCWFCGGFSLFVVGVCLWFFLLGF